MNYCPNCGAKRENDVCSCGYNYESGEVEKVEVPLEMIIKSSDNPNIVLHQGGVPLEELKRRRLDLGDLLAVNYTVSGGQIGQYSDLELSFEKNELKSIEKEWHHAPQINTYYKVDEEKAQEIKKILIDNNFSAWSEVPGNFSMIVFDAPNRTISLRFADKFLNIPSNIYMDQEEFDLYQKVVELLTSLKVEENKISEKVYTKDGTGTPSMVSKEAMSSMLNKEAKFCPECGSVLGDDDKECLLCGYKVPE